MAVNINRLRSAWEKSVGRASGISFDIASLLTDDPDELMLILSSSDEGMMVLDRIKKQYEKAQKLVKFANKFKEIKPGAGALFGDKLLAATNPHWNRFNAHGTTEHFTKPIAIPKARYEGFKAPIFTPNRFPIVTSEDAQIFREEDEASRIRQQDAMRRAEKSFHSTRDNRNWDDYLTGRTGDWSGYNPNDGPLAQIFREEEYKKERDKNTRLAESRGSIRNRKERLMLMRELPAFFRNSKMSTKDLRSMAKGFREIGRIPIIGQFIKHPALAAITTLLGAGAAGINYAIKRGRTLAGWQNARFMTGDISAGTFGGLAATGMSYEQMLQSLARYSIKASEVRFGGGFDKYAEIAKFGVDVSGLFNPYLSAEERRAEEYRVAMQADPADRAAILSSLGMSQEEFRAEHLKSTPWTEWNREDLQNHFLEAVRKEYKENHPYLNFFTPDIIHQWNAIGYAYDKITQQKNLKAYSDRIKSGEMSDVYFKSLLMSEPELANDLQRVWDEVHDTAEIDDRYRAGMYDNSTTNNGGDKNVNVEIHVASPQITTNGDPADFARGIATIGSRALSEYQSIIENIDTKRTN